MKKYLGNINVYITIYIYININIYEWLLIYGNKPSANAWYFEKFEQH